MTELKVTSKKYNDKDVLETENFSEEVNKSLKSATSGTIDKVLGLDSNGNIVKGDVSGGSQLYDHIVSVNKDSDYLCTIYLTSTQVTPINTFGDIIDHLTQYQGYFRSYSNSEVEDAGIVGLSADPNMSGNYYLSYLVTNESGTAVTFESVMLNSDPEYEYSESH